MLTFHTQGIHRFWGTPELGSVWIKVKVAKNLYYRQMNTEHDATYPNFV
jgi:hypothetical protein